MPGVAGPAITTTPYDQGGATLYASGGVIGIRQLVDHYYDIMASAPA